MNTTAQIAKHFRELHFGGNWTASNLKDNLTGLSWQEAAKTVYDCNSIAILVFHVNYYVSLVLKVLKGEPLSGSDKYSFNLPPITSQEDWDKLQEKVFAEAEEFASLVEQLPDTKLDEEFFDKKYGNYYRNLHGIIEHTHYHLGQIALLKKIILQADKHEPQ